jgi:hypothetical protein
MKDFYDFLIDSSGNTPAILVAVTAVPYKQHRLQRQSIEEASTSNYRK